MLERGRSVRADLLAGGERSGGGRQQHRERAAGVVVAQAVHRVDAHNAARRQLHAEFDVKRGFFLVLIQKQSSFIQQENRRFS